LSALKRKFNPEMRCYQCDVPLKKYTVKPGEQSPADAYIPDHVPPKGLFPKPRPNNLIEVPCCFECNNKHSGFDERLRIYASMPFDRNEIGQRILDEKVIGSTFARERQMQFLEKLAASMQAVPERPELIRARIDDQELKDGMIRITKGLLYALHPTFNYHKSTFTALSVSQQASDKQRNLMTQLMRGLFLERGQGVFQCWRHLDEARAGGVWMLILYGCFGYFVFHTSKPELHTRTLFGTGDRLKQAH
jgi:hypothetical protein